jgi:pimeloyl-ACP methyl ester carboxylesterase
MTPGLHPAITDIGTNLRALSGAPSSYQAAVILAMRDAGIRPDEPVMLVGHSQGGLVAASVASALAGSREFRVTHLVTAGSPLGQQRVPASVQALSLENRQDAVPLLDARDNPRQSNWTTVTVDRGTPVDRGGFGARHAVDGAYLPAAADVDASSDASIRAWRESAAGFFDGSSVQTVSFAVSRVR